MKEKSGPEIVLIASLVFGLFGMISFGWYGIVVGVISGAILGLLFGLSDSKTH